MDRRPDAVSGALSFARHNGRKTRSAWGRQGGSDVKRDSGGGTLQHTRYVVIPLCSIFLWLCGMIFDFLLKDKKQILLQAV